MTTDTATATPTTPAPDHGAPPRRLTLVRWFLGALALAPVPLVVAFLHAVVVHSTTPTGGGG